MALGDTRAGVGFHRFWIRSGLGCSAQLHVTGSTLEIFFSKFYQSVLIVPFFYTLGVSASPAAHSLSSLPTPQSTTPVHLILLAFSSSSLRFFSKVSNSFCNDLASSTVAAFLISLMISSLIPSKSLLITEIRKEGWQLAQVSFNTCDSPSTILQGRWQRNV